MNPRLGVNIDHFATLRQLRNTPYPSLAEVVQKVERAGAHQITVHLREDRRHIQDEDVKLLKSILKIPLNLEMALNESILKYALKIKPKWCCLVPEKRKEVTTEGGLLLQKNKIKIAHTILKLKKAGILVSLFVEPSLEAMKLSHSLGADAVELHTGRFALATQLKKINQKKIDLELHRIHNAAQLGKKLGLKVHAGHGLDDQNVKSLVSLKKETGEPLIEEYNIGHFIVCRSALIGVEKAVSEMLSSIQAI